MTIDLVDRLYESKDLESLMLCGLISPNVLLMRKMYHTHKARIEAGEKRVDAVNQTAKTFSVSQTTVYRALKVMNYERTSNP